MNEEVEEVNLVDAAYLYITESKYPRECKESRKRAIRKKAHMFVVRDGVMYFKKKKKDKVLSIYTLSIFFNDLRFTSIL